MMRLSELESRVERTEADADLAENGASGSEPEREFDKLESDDAVEEKLAALKKSMSKSGGTPAAAKGAGRKAAPVRAMPRSRAIRRRRESASMSITDAAVSMRWNEEVIL